MASNGGLLGEEFGFLDMLSLYNMMLNMSDHQANQRDKRHQKHIEEEIDDMHTKIDKIYKILMEGK